MLIAVIGATGLVGSTIIQVLEEQGFSNYELLPVASAKSKGKKITFGGKEYPVVLIEEALERKPKFALFSAGSAISSHYAPLFAKNGTIVIDNSSAWRMDPSVPLVIPEVNASAIGNSTIIANPNCSTIQMVLALFPLHLHYKIKRIVVSTYQSVTGTGIEAIKQLENEEKGIHSPKVYPHPIHRNLFPHGGDFLSNGYTTEEQKLIDETRKILDDQTIEISATVVRVPVVGGHSESINVEFYHDFELNELRTLLQQMQGIKVMDNTCINEYPMPILSEGKDDVFVGRIRRDLSQPNTLNIWVTADNLRKGAAVNAVQILAYLIKK